MTPFSVTCTTCRRSFRVVRPEAIGQILGCPKCGSMVLVEAPAGWSGEETSAAMVTATSEAGTAVIAKETSPNVPFAAAASSAPAIEQSAAEALAMLEAPAKPPPLKVPAAALKVPTAETNPPVPPNEVVSAVSLWPRWFVPSAVGVIAVSGLVVAVRLMMMSGDTEPAILPAQGVAVATEVAPILETPAPVENALPPAAPVANEKPLEEPPREEAKPTGDQPKTEPQPLAPMAADPTETERPAAETPPPHRFALSDPGLRPVIDDPATDPSPAAQPQLAENSVVNDVPVTPSAENPQRTLQRVPPRQVNVEARLSDPLASLEVRGMPLWQLLELLSNISGVPMSMDTAALRELNQTPASPISLRMSNTTVADVLESTLESLGLAHEVRDGNIVVGYGPTEGSRTISYTVDDLTKNDDAALADLVRLVPKLVSPASWQANGGSGSIAAGGGKLVVEQTPAVHRQIINFCERLRVARGLPIKSRQDPARFLLTTRETKAKSVLNRTITANFAAPQPVADVVAWLRETADCVIIIDHAALAAAGTSASSECAFVATDELLAKVLDKLVAPMELAWRVVDERTIEISTPAVALQHADVEFLPVGDLSRDAQAGQALVANILRSLDDISWGDGPRQACVQFDVPGHALLVRAPQRVQAAVEAELTKARAAK